jgi:hypothetical protein
MLRHILTQFNIANGNKQISQICRTIYDNFIQLTKDVKQMLKWRIKEETLRTLRNVVIVQPTLPNSQCQQIALQFYSV